MDGGTSWSLIDFDLPEEPHWREGLEAVDSHSSPIISEMIHDIARYQKIWKGSKERVAPDNLKSVKHQMLINFIQNVNDGEDIGTKEKSKTTEILSRMEDNENDSPKKMFKGSSSKSEVETKNLYRAWQHLVRVADKGLHEDPGTLGLLDLDECVVETHKILMEDLIEPSKNTPAGKFSTNIRHTKYKDKTYVYPRRNSPEEVEKIVDTLIFRYNKLIDSIKKIESASDLLTKLFKLSAFFLNTIVSEHPFSDGNGRLCRMLVSYTLRTVTPFPSPIFNIYCPSVRYDYMDALLEAQKPDGTPSDLAALIVESNWDAWRHFLRKLNLM